MAKELTKFEVLEQEARSGFLARLRKENESKYKLFFGSLWWNSDFAPLFFAPLIVMDYLLWNSPLVGWNFVIGLLLSLPIAHVLPLCLLLYVFDFNDRRELEKLDTPRKIIMEYQRQSITDMQERAIGEHTPFKQDVKRMKTKLKQLTDSKSEVERLLESETLRYDTQYGFDTRFMRGMSNYTGEKAERWRKHQESLPPQLAAYKQLTQLLQQKIEAHRKNIEKCEQFVAKVNARVQTRLTHLSVLDEVLDQQEIIARAIAHCQDPSTTSEEVDAMIIKILAQLQSDHETMQKEIRHYYEESGIALAITACESSGTFDDILLDSMIGQCIPAKLEDKTKAS